MPILIVILIVTVSMLAIIVVAGLISTWVYRKIKAKSNEKDFEPTASVVPSQS